MRTGLVSRILVIGGVMLAVGGGVATTGVFAKAQQEKPGSGAIPGMAQPIGSPEDVIVPDGPMRARMKEERIKSFNDARHKRLEDDVTKLQALTNDLKSEVDKANTDELSMDVIRKASEIEKLAHDVQSRMKNN